MGGLNLQFPTQNTLNYWLLIILYFVWYIIVRSALSSLIVNPLSPNIHIQILQTGLYTFS